jgi:hypothetical protein
MGRVHKIADVTEAPRQAIAAQLQWQADACRMIGSELYAALLERAADDVNEGGPTWEILRGHEQDPRFSVLGLRLMGGANRLALTGREPDLAEAYRSGRDVAQTWGLLRDVLRRNAAELRQTLDRPVQTNEVARCAALVFGFLSVAEETRLPLRLLEVGASAGLNLRWDRFRYEANGFAWGPAGSAVKLEFELDGKPAPNLPPSVEIGDRRGCDTNPIDATTAEGQLTLLTYIWPDQVERIERMRAALEVAAELPIELDREPAAGWARRMLAEPAPGQATVIYHSIVSQYLSDEERDGLFSAIREAGGRATDDAPLAWLRMEPADDRANLELTLWPGGADRHLARVGYHGTPVELL